MARPLPVTANTSFTAPENRAFYPALDGLRAVAFLMVFLQHYMLLPWGNSGVNVFFVLSGFLITGILWDSRESPHRARNFYLRRTLRIFPLYYSIFLILALTTPLLHWQWSRYWIAWPLYLGNFLRFLGPTSLQLNSALQAAADAQLRIHVLPLSDRVLMGHFWSLCVEEQFYLVWPWVVFGLASRRALLWICGTIVVLLPVVRFFLQPHLPQWTLTAEIFYRVTPFELDSLLLGALVALIWRTRHRDTMLRFARMVTPAALLLCALAYLWTMHRSPEAFDKFAFPVWRWTFGLTLVNGISALVMLCCLSVGTWTYRLLGLRWLRWLGRISYGAYIFHDMPAAWATFTFRRYFPAFTAAHRFGTRLSIAAPCLLLTIMLAWLSFRFLETPFLNLKEKWTLS